MLKKFKKLYKHGTSSHSGCKRPLSHFSKNEEGIAAIEFALLAPLLIAVTLGSTEIIQSVWADGKVEQATSTIGDLVSRTSVMTDNELRELGAAGPLVLRPYPENDLKFTITSVIGCYDDVANKTDLSFYVLWSKEWEAGSIRNSSHSLDSEFNRLPRSLDIEQGDTIIFTEGTYSYAPTIARKVGTTYDMGGTIFHQPRTSNQRVAYPSAESSTPRSCADF